MAYEDIILAELGLVNYWQLGEASGSSIADSKGSNPGTIQGGVTLGQSGIPGSAKTAALFNGSTGYISTLNQIASPGPVGPLTMECWWKYISGAAGGGLISFNNPQTGALSVASSPVVFEDSGANVHMGTLTTGSQEADGGVSMNDHIWHHLVATIAANGNLQFFIDGKLQATNATTQAPANVAGYWRIGNAFTTGYTFGGGSSAQWANGLISHVALYNIVLAQGRINQHYFSGANLAGKGGNPVARGKTPTTNVPDFVPLSTTSRVGQIWPRGH